MHLSPSYQFIKADPEISDFVYGYSSLKDISNYEEGIIIPNGRIDLMFCKMLDGSLKAVLIGLETKPKAMPKQFITAFVCVNLNPLGLEYILHETIAEFVNEAKIFPVDFWDITVDDLNDFELFHKKVDRKIKTLLPKDIDVRKLQLFRHIFESDGEVTVKDLSEKIFWSERQINRYFKQQLGIPLKSYCNILRFQASLLHIKSGQLYPQLNYSDQSHFIKEIKKLSGVSPKELFKNENDRFLQFLFFNQK